MFSSEAAYGPRLGVSLCHCSSEEAGHPGTALRFHTQNAPGWQSSKACVYPQELGLAFDGEVELHYIRLLSHESKISSRIEVFIANATDEEMRTCTVKSYESSTFYRLGYVNFSSKSEHNDSVRELKTINIRRKCIYVKLLFLGPHRTDYNIFNQVGIIAITTHGLLLRAFQNLLTKRICFIGETVEVPLNEMTPPRLGKLPSPHPENNSFETEIDSVTSRRITEIVQMKDRAVVLEDYDLAANLKAYLKLLEGAGKQIYELEKQKVAAVMEENYILAKELKNRIDRFREEAYKIPTTLPEKLDEVSVSLPCRKDSEPVREEGNNQIMEGDKGNNATFHAAVVADPPAVVFDELPVRGRGRYILEEACGATKIEGKGEEDFAVVDTHALALMEGKEKWEQTINRIILQHVGDQPLPSQLEGQLCEEARSIEKVFGSCCTACLFGKIAPFREAAIRAIISPEGFAALYSHSPCVIETLLSFMSLPSRGFSDTSIVVVLACCEALQAILDGEICNAPPVTALLSYIQPVFEGLVIRLGDNNNRIRDSVWFLFMSLSTIAPEVVVSALLMDVHNIKKKPVPYKVHVARMNLLFSLVGDHGVNSDILGFDAESVILKAILPCLQHSKSEVRNSAGRLFAKILIVAPDFVEQQLKLLKPAQQDLIEQHVRNLKMTESGFLDQANVELNVSFLSEVASKSGKRHSAAQSIQAGVDGHGEQAAMVTCQFCGETKEGVSAASLDIHFIRACPMLCPCPLCDQVIEIANLQQHLITECEKQELVRECPICTEAVRVEDIKKHVAAKRCAKAVSTESVCPLCHARFKAGKAGWLEHLALPPGCPNNPRKYDGSGPI